MCRLLVFVVTVPPGARLVLVAAERRDVEESEGAHQLFDAVVPSTLSEDLHRRTEGSELIIYPDSGHGGIFQYHDKFAPVAVEFLDR